MQEPSVQNSFVKLTYLGLGCFQLLVPGRNERTFGILINPETGIQPPEASVDYVLLTHYSRPIWEQARLLTERHKATIVVISDFSNWIRSLEPGLQTIPLTPDGEVELSWGSAVLTASHYQYRLPNGTTEPGNGFILKILGNQIYYSGPATYDAEVRVIGQVFMPNVSILTTGPDYLNPEEMARSIMWLGSDLVFPVFRGLPEESEPAERFREEIFSTIDAYTPAICRMLEPGGSYELMRVESSGRQAGPESRY